MLKPGMSCIRLLLCAQRLKQQKRLLGLDD